MAAVQGNLLPSASPLPGEKGPEGEKGEGEGSTLEGGRASGDQGLEFPQSFLNTLVKLEYRRKGISGCPPSFPNLAGTPLG